MGKHELQFDGRRFNLTDREVLSVWAEQRVPREGDFTLKIRGQIAFDNLQVLLEMLGKIG